MRREGDSAGERRGRTSSLLRETRGRWVWISQPFFPVLQKSRLGMKQYGFPVWFGSTGALASQRMWS